MRKPNTLAQLSQRKAAVEGAFSELRRVTFGQTIQFRYLKGVQVYLERADSDDPYAFAKSQRGENTIGKLNRWVV